MITGFNTDVERGSTVFHVQTEEKGPANPVVVTLVYCGGQIVGAFEAPYAGGEDSPETRAVIRELMLEQHRGRIRDVHAGKYDAQLHGENGPSERSLDELVLDCLDRSIDDARPQQTRAARTARVLDRLERMLSAAERAQASAATTAETADPAAALDLARDTTEPAPPRATLPVPVPARRARRGRHALAALIAAAAVTAPILVLVWSALSQPAPIELAAPLPAAPAVELASPLLAFALPPSPLEPQPSAVEVAATAPPAAATRPAAQVPRKGTSAPRPPREARSIQPPAPAAPPPSELAAERAPAGPAPHAPEAQGALPAEPAVENGDLVDLAAVDVRPLVRRRDLPRYTARARRAGLQGTVELALLIDEHGEVADVTLLHDGTGGDLVDESLATVRGWTFSPARKERQPVKVWQPVAIDFTILPNRSTSVRIRE